MNCADDSPKQVSHSSKLTLTITGLGHVPSFKNGKMMSRGKLITDPKKQKWMKAASASIESQLQSLFQTAEAGTQTGQSLQSWIQSSMQLDDDLAWVGVTCGSWRRVSKGKEGAMIEIEKL